jgi:hypothetical protein
VAVVPFWAFWPFARPSWRRVGILLRLTNLDDDEHAAPAELLTPAREVRQPVRRSFPYSMGWHGAPGHDEMPSTGSFGRFPPLRSATTRKFVAGYELFAEAAESSRRRKRPSDRGPARCALLSRTSAARVGREREVAPSALPRAAAIPTRPCARPNVSLIGEHTDYNGGFVLPPPSTGTCA